MRHLNTSSDIIDGKISSSMDDGKFSSADDLLFASSGSSEDLKFKTDVSSGSDTDANNADIRNDDFVKTCLNFDAILEAKIDAIADALARPRATVVALVRPGKWFRHQGRGPV